MKSAHEPLHVSFSTARQYDAVPEDFEPSNYIHPEVMKVLRTYHHLVKEGDPLQWWKKAKKRTSRTSTSTIK